MRDYTELKSPFRIPMHLMWAQYEYEMERYERTVACEEQL